MTHEDETLIRLRARVAGNLRPVKPLPGAWMRALFVVPLALLCFATLSASRGLRTDAGVLGPTLWGLGFLELVAAYVMFTLVLRSAIPGRELSPRYWVGLPILVIALQLGIGHLTFQKSPLAVAAGMEIRLGGTCLSFMTLVGLVPLGAGLWLLSRGLAVRPRIAGLLVGFSSGLMADLVYRAHCPFSNTAHLLWHCGAVTLLGAFGFLAGAYGEASRLRAREREHARSFS